MYFIIRWQSRVLLPVLLVLTLSSRAGGTSTRILSDITLIIELISETLSETLKHDLLLPADVLKGQLMGQLTSSGVRVRGLCAPAINHIPQEVSRLF